MSLYTRLQNWWKSRHRHDYQCCGVMLICCYCKTCGHSWCDSLRGDRIFMERWSVCKSLRRQRGER